jgi:hypothetical protein
MGNSKDKHLIIKGEVDSSVWGKIQDLAKGSAREKVEAVGLLFENYRVIPDSADDLILGLAREENSVVVRREIAKRLAKKTGIPWVLHVKVIEVLSKDKDKQVQDIVQPIFEPYKKINDYFSQLLKAWSEGLNDWVHVFESIMPPQLHRELVMIGEEPQAGTLAEIIKNWQTTTKYFEPDFILPIAKRLDEARLPDINRLYSDSVLSISNNFAKNSLQFVPSYSSVPAEPEIKVIVEEPEGMKMPENPLISKLKSIPPGKSNWHDYQEVCQEIMSYCLVPPLWKPNVEVTDEAGIHRRDIVYPIPGGIDGFWGFIQSVYSTIGVVVDAKNYGDELPPSQIVVVSKYFGEKKLGNFGIIISRKGASVSAKKEQIDRWVHHREMIVCLSDSDIEEMVGMKARNGEPWEILNRKIFEIRKSA